MRFLNSAHFGRSDINVTLAAKKTKIKNKTTWNTSSKGLLLITLILLSFKSTSLFQSYRTVDVINTQV